jgi:hypothetical protein
MPTKVGIHVFSCFDSKDVDGRPSPTVTRGGLGWQAQFRDSQHIASTVWFANITTMVHDQQ